MKLQSLRICVAYKDHMLKEATFQLPDPSKVAPMIIVGRCTSMIYLVSKVIDSLRNNPCTECFTFHNVINLRFMISII